MRSYIIFTDLDGTLLDHDSYSWKDAQPALDRLKALEIPLIINSSKTCAEILQLRDELSNKHPFIVENGSAVYFPLDYFSKSDRGSDKKLERHYFTDKRDSILELLQQLRKIHGFQFRGFNDMSIAELATVTGLTREESIKAKARDCSEPIEWQGREEDLLRFKQQIEAKGLRLLRGGRFYHVMGATDKVAGINWVIEQYKGCWPEKRFVTVALGDSPNDQGMLEAVDIPVVIDPAKGKRLQLKHSPNAIYPGIKGARGWRKAIDAILNTG